MATGVNGAGGAGGGFGCVACASGGGRTWVGWDLSVAGGGWPAAWDLSEAGGGFCAFAGAAPGFGVGASAGVGFFGSASWAGPGFATGGADFPPSAGDCAEAVSAQPSNATTTARDTRLIPPLVRRTIKGPL
jgi:hypothetical protein